MNEHLTPSAAFELVCTGIDEQNLNLIGRVNRPDFNPGIELDSTRNNAEYKLTDFFAALKLFKYGRVPIHIADPVVKSTDALHEELRKRYAGHRHIVTLILRSARAFRASKKIWRITNVIAEMPDSEYHAKLDEALTNILNALSELNIALYIQLDATPPAADPPPAGKPPEKHGRAKIPQTFAAQAMGVSKRTLQRIEKSPQSMAEIGYPGRNIAISVFMDWANEVRKSKILKKAALDREKARL